MNRNSSELSQRNDVVDRAIERLRAPTRWYSSIGRKNCGRFRFANAKMISCACFGVLILVRNFAGDFLNGGHRQAYGRRLSFLLPTNKVDAHHALVGFGVRPCRGVKTKVTSSARREVVVPLPYNFGLAWLFGPLRTKPIASILSIDNRDPLGALVFVVDQIMADLGSVGDVRYSKASRMQNVELRKSFLDLDPIQCLPAGWKGPGSLIE